MFSSLRLIGILYEPGDPNDSFRPEASIIDASLCQAVCHVAAD